MTKIIPFTGRKKHPESRPKGLTNYRERAGERKEATKEARKKRVSVREMRQKVIELLGSKCCKCGFDDIRALQIDHINNDGYLERKKLSQWMVYKEMYLSVTGQSAGGRYQLLCANCNWIKRYENSSGCS